MEFVPKGPMDHGFYRDDPCLTSAKTLEHLVTNRRLCMLVVYAPSAWWQWSHLEITFCQFLRTVIAG